MANSNQFLAFGTATGANVLGQSAYSALTARSTGFQSGVALSQQVNKTLRQATSMTAMLGAFIAAYGGDALDDGDLTTLRANFEAALAYIIDQNLPAETDLSGYLQKAGGAMTGHLRAGEGFWSDARILTSGATLTTDDAGQLIEITASSNVIVNLPSPAYPGNVMYLWNNSVANHSIKTPTAGAFQGPNQSGAESFALKAGATATMISDGYNWVVSSITIDETATTAVAPRLSWFTTSDTYTPQDGTSYALVIAAGGGGGGGDGSSSSGRGGGGGGGGESVIRLLPLASISSASVSIGAGGSNSDGDSQAGNGGTTTFGSYVSAAGGSGGYAGTSAGDYGSAGNGGYSSGAGTIHLRGGTGAQSSDESGGPGGGGFLGLGGGKSSGYSSGTNGTNGFRGGGGGGGHGPSASSGGTGGSGCCIVVEW
ncbi:glycine-rich domain-containing protein [Xanthobacter agilis]|uniref:Glycine-rich domain-containing protein n=1 Tax=Xanthobacter agilis TaxID=47492 RepID=A0ABU0LJV7_XANAG|nr:hypothetical protein [Xanthobacter agilis]MDQ0507430.1 hypothetical protein [Xanthobacter agilis]